MIKAITRWIVLVVLAFIALQLFFVLRVALMVVVDPESTTFQRSQLWRPVPAGTPRPVPTPGVILASITQGQFDGATYDRELPARQQATLY